MLAFLFLIYWVYTKYSLYKVMVMRLEQYLEKEKFLWKSTVLGNFS